MTRSIEETRSAGGEGDILLEARGLGFSYGENSVLEDVSLDLRRGEMVGILGPNGGGKSTLLRLLSGVLEPKRGEVRLHGRPLREWSRPEIGRTVAVVPQDTHIEFPFSVTEVVLMGRAPHLAGFAFETERDIEVARRAMERTGVTELGGRTIQEVSGGERQRVILARALAQEAEVLLLDEPGAFLDIRHAVEIHDLLRELPREGKAVLCVLHDLNLAALYCDRVALFAGGRLVRLGPPAEVITYAAITQVFETEVYVDRNDITGAVNVLPLSRAYREALRQEKK